VPYRDQRAAALLRSDTDRVSRERRVVKSWQAATLAPFRSRIFLAVWAATLVSNFGSLIQAVGASWLMTSLAPSPDLVALVQASASLPIMLLSLPAGAVADIWDRRFVMLVAQVLMFVISVVITVVSWRGHITPWTLLALTFLIGCGVALYGPAWQSSVGEQVPREHIPAAVTLNALAFNIARTAGPAIGGVIVATAGPSVAFLVNALTYIGLIIVLLSWRRERAEPRLPPESMMMAMFAGLRYVRMSPQIRTVLIRGFALGLFGASIWSLMPLVARDLLGGGAMTYGLLFGAFGSGAVIGALTSTTARARTSGETLVRIAGVGFGAAIAVTAASPWLALTLVTLVVAGACWVMMLSTFNIVVQMSSPHWVVGRALAAYQMVTFAGLAIGSWMWGEAAAAFGLAMMLFVSGVAFAASTLLGVKAPLSQTEGLNLTPLRSSPLHPLPLDALPESGPVVLTVEYRVDPADYAAFATAMGELRRIRRRDGARRWTLMQDLEQPERWIERFHSESWIEHLRHYERFTVADEEAERRVLAFHRGPEPPRVRHLIERPAAALEMSAEAGEFAKPTVIEDPSLPAGSSPRPGVAAHRH
jgi:MFS family permease